MKKKTKKALALALCAVMLVAGTALTTIAYLTSKDSVTNTFTVGKVNITLDEATVNEYGMPVNANKVVIDDDNDGIADPEEIAQAPREKSNEYKLVPGVTYVKDPTVHVEKGSEQCYVRMLLTVQNIDQLKAGITGDEYTVTDGDYEVFLLEELVKGWDGETWVMSGYSEKTVGEGDEAVETATYEFRYKEVVDAREATANIDLPALFTTFTLPTTVTEGTIDNLDAVKIDVAAHAIQKAGFTTVDEAWTAFDEQNK